MNYRIEISHHIPGFPNYQITREGRVKNIKTNKYLKNRLDTPGYYYVGLYHEGKLKNIRIHRLLAEAFIPNSEGKETVDHLNRNKLDNRLVNLRWATMKEQSNNRNEISEPHRDNILRELHISITKNINTKYRVRMTNPRIDKYFLTLQEAITYRDSIINN